MELPLLGEIGRRRRKSGMTQQQLAACAGISQSLVAKIEGGKVEPAYSSVAKIFSCLEEIEKKEGKKAGEIASQKVMHVCPQDGIEKAAGILRRHGFSQMPVMVGGRIIGSISEEKIIGLLQKRGEIGKIKVEDEMEEPFPRISKNAPVSMVAELLRHEPAVVVTEKEKVIGIITKSDLLKLF